MKNPEALTYRIPKGLLRPVAGKLYLYFLFATQVMNFVFKIKVKT
jgi:hypothetical protein